MSEENIGGEEGIIEERRKKLQLLRDKNKAYINDFVKKHYAKSLHRENDSFSKNELEKKNTKNKGAYIASTNNISGWNILTPINQNL